MDHDSTRSRPLAHSPHAGLHRGDQVGAHACASREEARRREARERDDSPPRAAGAEGGRAVSTTIETGKRRKLPVDAPCGFIGWMGLAFLLCGILSMWGLA